MESVCPECQTDIKPDFKFCPRCKTTLKHKKIEQTLEGVENIIADTEPLYPDQLAGILKIFQNNENAKKNPTYAHRLEEKIYLKVLRSIESGDYTLREMGDVVKK